MGGTCWPTDYTPDASAEGQGPLGFMFATGTALGDFLYAMRDEKCGSQSMNLKQHAGECLCESVNGDRPPVFTSHVSIT